MSTYMKTNALNTAFQLLYAYTFHIAVFAIEAEGKETYFPETR